MHAVWAYNIVTLSNESKHRDMFYVSTRQTQVLCLQYKHTCHMSWQYKHTLYEFIIQIEMLYDLIIETDVACIWKTDRQSVWLLIKKKCCVLSQVYM